MDTIRQELKNVLTMKNHLTDFNYPTNTNFEIALDSTMFSQDPDTTYMLQTNGHSLPLNITYDADSWKLKGNSASEDMLNLVLYASNTCSAVSDTFRILFKRPVITGIAYNHSSDLIYLYPNPTHDQLYIKGTHLSPIFIQLYSADGILVRAETCNDRITTDQLKPGIYLLKWQEDGKQVLLRFVKSN
jgi:hypothetical protein